MTPPRSFPGTTSTKEGDGPGRLRRSRQRIAFLIEDDSSVAPLLEDMLRQLGYDEVWHAETVAGALLILGHHRPDVALLDTNLLGAPSYRVAERLKEIGVPFVVVTGYDPVKLPDLLRSTAILRKPFGVPELTAALDAVVPRPAA